MKPLYLILFFLIIQAFVLATKPSPILDMAIEVNGEPRIGNEIELILKAKLNFFSDKPYPINLSFELPEGVDLVSGERVKYVEIKYPYENEFGIKVKLNNLGRYEIRGTAGAPNHEGWFQSTIIYLDVNEESGNVITAEQLQRQLYNEYNRQRIYNSFKRNATGILAFFGILVIGMISYVIVFRKKA